MDRNTYKAEEKDLSDKLHKKLQALMLLYPPTDEFKKCFTEDMFIKSNQTAFFQVMHYLFRLYDPVEFRKRFYWPLSDKKMEALFRSNTVEYLKHLNEKHNLNWAHIKSYLVVMPGGMKFMSFLLDFVSFVITELTKQKEHKLDLNNTANDGASSAILTSKDILSRSVQNIQYLNNYQKEYFSQYLMQVEMLTKQYMQKHQELNEELRNLSKSLEIEVDEMQSEQFLEDFEKSNEDVYRQNFIKRKQAIAEMDEPLTELREIMEKFQAAETEIKFDKDKVRQSLAKIKEMFPEQGGMLEGDF